MAYGCSRQGELNQQSRRGVEGQGRGAGGSGGVRGGGETQRQRAGGWATPQLTTTPPGRVQGQQPRKGKARARARRRQRAPSIAMAATAVAAAACRDASATHGRRGRLLDRRAPRVPRRRRQSGRGGKAAWGAPRLPPRRPANPHPRGAAAAGGGAPDRCGPRRLAEAATPRPYGAGGGEVRDCGRDGEWGCERDRGTTETGQRAGEIKFGWLAAQQLGGNSRAVDSHASAKARKVLSTTSVLSSQLSSKLKTVHG